MVEALPGEGMFNHLFKNKMKKIIAVSIAAIAATIVLSAFGSENGSKGTIRFESTDMPALNFTMPVSRAADIFMLLPESVTSVCCREYAIVRGQCNNTSQFTYEGVNIQCAGADPTLQFVFTVPGYKLSVSDVSWDTLDDLFGMVNQ